MDQQQQSQPRSRIFSLVMAIVIILAVVIGWHFLLPVLGLTLAITAGAWAVIVTTVAVFCIAVILFFIFGGAGMVVVGFVAVLWALLAIILFPVFFPIIVPLMIILFVIGLLRRKRQ